MPKALDLVGQKFDRLTVISRTDKNLQGNYSWLCRCNCGKEKIVSGSNLMTGHTKSCGCFAKERLVKRSTKHGHRCGDRTSMEYVVWKNMIQRCTNQKCRYYKYYGGRGITICKRWKKFENFLKDMGEVPKDHQIDRIDNNKGYDKSNCHWVTAKQNCRNRRSNYLITHNGKTQCISAWSEELGIRRETLYTRINRDGWSVEKALTTPTKGKKKNE